MSTYCITTKSSDGDVNGDGEELVSVRRACVALRLAGKPGVWKGGGDTQGNCVRQGVKGARKSWMRSGEGELKTRETLQDKTFLICLQNHVS